ncbi:hypothetical protein EXM63_03890 [Clostridium botulinum]|uniref:DUF3139 domain-containing protein n=1 Tax=Clostridium botulinum TaxID=1491 RepID=A0A6M0T0R0_CLOBO|nr:hypothetical protein [Clostridium botulinum]NFI74456.1 hypothetical protein [Clostridium sporogenes]NFP62364.1 hypothetical protein [Clostridium sporogenes]NFU95484.1 hypothetical protein [Clostridium sporogenes]NFV68196.1 hypothetical protein [Clostridium botulinum]
MEDYLAAICILIMVLGLGLLVYDKVFLPVVYSEDSYNKDNYTNNDIEYKNLDKTEELIKKKLGKDALVMYTSLESTGKDSEDVVVRVSLDSNEYRVIFNTKKVTKDMVYYEPVSIKSINKIH